MSDWWDKDRLLAKVVDQTLFRHFQREVEKLRAAGKDVSAGVADFIYAEPEDSLFLLKFDCATVAVVVLRRKEFRVVAHGSSTMLSASGRSKTNINWLYSIYRGMLVRLARLGNERARCEIAEAQLLGTDDLKAKRLGRTFEQFKEMAKVGVLDEGRIACLVRKGSSRQSRNFTPASKGSTPASKGSPPGFDPSLVACAIKSKGSRT